LPQHKISLLGAQDKNRIKIEGCALKSKSSRIYFGIPCVNLQSVGLTVLWDAETSSA
jgi:hypothetical protein